MSLLSPWWLLLLLFSGLIVYWHRKRRVSKTVDYSSLALWKKLNLPPPNLKNTVPPFNWLLLLQLLALLAVVLALSQPFVGALVSRGNHTIMVLDASQSMEQHFSRAKQQIQQAGLRGKVSLVWVSDTPRTVFARVQNPKPDALNTLTVSHTPADWYAAYQQVQGLSFPTERTTVQVYSDPSGKNEAGSLFKNAQWHTAEASKNNLAFSGVRLQKSRVGYTLTGEIVRHGTQSQTVLSIVLGDKTTTHTLNVQDRTPFSIPVISIKDTLHASLPEDDIPSDSNAFFNVGQHTLKVLWLGKPDSVWQKALSNMGASIQTAPLSEQKNYDIAVVNSEKNITPSIPTLYLNIPSQKTTQAFPVAWHTHSLGNGVDWYNLNIKQAQVRNVEGAYTVLASHATALIQSKGDDVWVNFALQNSNWLSLNSFAVFVGNWLSAQRLATQCTVGTWCAVPAKSVELSGKTIATASGFIPMQAGFYRYSYQGKTYTLAVNPVYSASESAPSVNSTSNTSETSRSASGVGLPVWLWLLLLAVLLLMLELWLSFRSEGFKLRSLRLPSLLAKQRRRNVAMQLLGIVFLLCAVLGVPILWRSTQSKTVLVAAAGGNHAFSQYVAKGGNVGMVSGSEIYSDVGSSFKRSKPQNSTFDLTQSLSLASGMVGERGNIVVLNGGYSEGLEALTPEIVAQNIKVYYAAPKNSPLRMNINAPSSIFRNEAANVHIRVFSQQNQEVTLTLWQNRAVILQKTLKLQQGDNRLALPLSRGGSYVLGVGDIRQGFAIAETEKARVLVVGNATDNLVQALQQNFTVKSTAALGKEALNNYQAIVLHDVPISTIHPETLAALPEWVEQGGKLFIAGAGQSFANGGYVQTLLDSLSPLSSQVLQKAPKMALVLILDKSGSMNEDVGGMTKMDLIKASALGTLKVLKTGSDLGVIAFDTAPKLAVPIQSVSNKQDIENLIARIEPEGGTAVSRALDAALKEIIKSKAMRKHMILLTDGIDGGIYSPQTYERIVKRAVATGVTISTIGIGSGMHLPMMKQIAEWGGGIYNYTSDWRNLPSLMSQDTLMQGEPLLQKTAFAPLIAENSPMLDGLPSPLPALTGYIQTTLKPTAKAYLLTPSGDPLLASWSYGRGEVLAMAAPVSGSWASAWVAQPTYPKIMSQWVRQGLNAAMAVQPAGNVLALSENTAITTPETEQFTTQKLRLAGEGFYSVAGTEWYFSPREQALSPSLKRLAEVSGGGEIGDQLPQTAQHWIWLNVWQFWVCLALLCFMLSVYWRFGVTAFPSKSAKNKPMQ